MAKFFCNRRWMVCERGNFGALATMAPYFPSLTGNQPLSQRAADFLMIVQAIRLCSAFQAGG
jgi:hypothetical protein